MEYILLLSVLVTGVFGGGNHNHHHVTVVADCFGTPCDSHHFNCRVHHDNTGAYVGTCVDGNHCINKCTDAHASIPCCCPDQGCVDGVRNGNLAALAASTQVGCPNCHNLHDCDLHLHDCHPDQVCLIQKHGHDIKTKCANQHECDHAKAEAMKHQDQTATCCKDDNCTHAQIQLYTAGMPQTLHCTSCHDLLTNQCDGDHTCKHDDVCMINHIDNRVQTGCTKKPECEHQLHNSANTPHATTLCCETLNCSQTAFSQAHQVMTVTSSAPPASTAAPSVSGTNVSNSVAPATTSGVCSDIEDVNFKCADYIRDFDICNQNTGTGSVLASTRCKMSCGLCPVPTTSPPCNDNEDATFQCANYIKDFDICHQTSGVGLTLATTRCQKSCGLCSSGSSLLQTQTSIQSSSVQTTLRPQTTTQAPTVNLAVGAVSAIQAQPAISSAAPSSTTAARTNPPCIDHDVNNSCTAYSFYFCGATSGAARAFAIANCAKSCNLCNEYFASLQNSQAVPIVG